MTSVSVLRRAIATLLALVALSGCPTPVTPTWRTIASELDEAALSVSAEPNAVWVVGADRGKGPLVLRSVGDQVTRLATGFEGDLWWVQAFPDGSALMGGTSGLLLRSDGEHFTRLATPSLGKQTIFGLWGSSARDAWLVGGAAGREGFIWRLEGDTVTNVLLPSGVPLRADAETPALLKVWGDASGTVWVVGDRGALLRKGAGESAFSVVATGSTERFFTVHGAGGQLSLVGGNAQGVIFDGDGSSVSSAAPSELDLVQGVFRTSATEGWAVGAGGLVLERTSKGWQVAKGTQPISAESLHAVAVDAAGRVWAVGGNVISPSLNHGVVLVRSATDVPTYTQPEPVVPPVACPADDVDPAPGKSIARRWNEQLLYAIRRDTPRPGVHARNLFHVSAAMYDAWAAFDATADGVFVREKVSAGSDLEHQRDVAISYAALRVLEHRYASAIGGATSMACFHAFMQKLALDPNDRTATGGSGVALGNRVAAAIIAAHRDDGANEGANYADPSWTPLNPPLVVDLPGTTMTDPSKWQPLNLAQAVTQNGIVQPGGVQGYIGANWGHVRPFALGAPLEDGGTIYLDAGVVPAFDDAMKPMVVDVIRKSGWLDPSDTTTIDLSPGALGNNSLGADDGTGHAMNPATGQPYEAHRVLRADFGRVLAEFWADGPKSETPPGHWNVLANQVADTPGFERRWQGQGTPLSPLEWDVKLYLALNGAVHDAAIVAWGTKRVYQCSRPISLIRYMAQLGQSSEPTGPRYHPMGLPLVPGLIELVTEQSAAPGQRHERLKAYVGHVAIRTWRGEPGDRRHTIGGVDWIRAVEWVPYQRRTFVTPAFPGFISGHSTFSRAGAEVLTALTGSAFFPGGLAGFTAPTTYLTFEQGPTAPITLQWATYFDAADQAGQSRIWGGIHITADDYTGRRLGSEVGLRATARALSFFDGTAVP
ncbi:MAG: DUF6851 domain-containing protein [Myxococcota bacterium]